MSCWSNLGVDVLGSSLKSSSHRVTDQSRALHAALNGVPPPALHRILADLTPEQFGASRPEQQHQSTALIHSTFVILTPNSGRPPPCRSLVRTAGPSHPVPDIHPAFEALHSPRVFQPQHRRVLCLSSSRHLTSPFQCERAAMRPSRKAESTS